MLLYIFIFGDYLCAQVCALGEGHHETQALERQGSCRCDVVIRWLVMCRVGRDSAGGVSSAPKVTARADSFRPRILIRVKWGIVQSWGVCRCQGRATIRGMSKLPSKKKIGVPRPPAGGARAPVVSRSHVQQSESRRILEDVLSPWLVTRWEQHDYGVDAMIEITAPVHGTPDHHATGRLFAVQLRSTDAGELRPSLSVTTIHLRYWLDYSVPVFLVNVQLATKAMTYRLIDDALQAELRERSPTFWAQGQVAVPLREPLLATSKADIESVVLRFRRRELAVPPSRFFQLQQGVLDIATRLERLSIDSGVESLKLHVDEVRRTFKTRPFVVAITGPQRVGKSTLVNALLGVDVSPVADYPTTAVPIEFHAGDVPTATVYFGGGRAVTVAPTSEGLRPYAAQQDNDGNDQQVQLVHVVLPNDVLARGMSLVDTPGRHDASPFVRRLTDKAIDQADAVLYVLDASLGAKFKLGQGEVEDLQNLQKSKERLILVLNQEDGLDPAKRASMLDYLSGVLKKYNILNGLSVPPTFASGKLAWDALQQGLPAPQEFTDLQEQLWGHLLRSKSTGLDRLDAAVVSLATACDSAVAMLGDHVCDGQEAHRLTVANRTSAAAIAEIESSGRRWHKKVSSEIIIFLKASSDHAHAKFRAELEAVPLRGALPDHADLGKRLQSEIADAVSAVLSHIDASARDLAKQQGERVQRALSDSSTELGMPMNLKISPTRISLGGFDNSLPEFGFGILGGLLGFLGGPWFGVATIVLGGIWGIFTGEERRHRRKVKDLLDKHAEHWNSTGIRLHDQANDRLGMTSNWIRDQGVGRLDTFMRDAAKRVERLGVAVTPGEAKRLTAIVSEISQLRSDLKLVSTELTGTMRDLR